MLCRPLGLEIRLSLPRVPAGFAASAPGHAVPRFQRWYQGPARYHFSCYRPLVGVRFPPRSVLDLDVGGRRMEIDNIPFNAMN